MGPRSPHGGFWILTPSIVSVGFHDHNRTDKLPSMVVGCPVFADTIRAIGRRNAFQSATEAAITIATKRPTADRAVHLKTGCLRQNAFMSFKIRKGAVVCVYHEA